VQLIYELVTETWFKLSKNKYHTSLSEAKNVLLLGHDLNYNFEPSKAYRSSSIALTSWRYRVGMQEKAMHKPYSPLACYLISNFFIFYF
jgi:hypothetical protein